MDELIPIRKSKGGCDVVSARELHQFLEVGTRIDIWFNRRAEEYLFVQGVDYQRPVLDNGFTDYIITLDMTKELAMVERNEKGRQIRQYFIWAETKLRALAQLRPLPCPRTCPARCGSWPTAWKKKPSFSMNELIPITLANGSVTQPYKLRVYFDRVIAAEQSGEEFPVSLDDIWRIGFPRKDHAVRALRKAFVQDVDYQIFLTFGENPASGRPTEVYRLSMSCLEFLAVRANRDVFEVYRACRKVLVKVMQGSLPDFSDPVVGARAWADAEEGRRTALALATAAATQLEIARPKVAFFDAVAVASNCIPMSTAAGVLKLPGIGRNLLFQGFQGFRTSAGCGSPAACSARCCAWP